MFPTSTQPGTSHGVSRWVLGFVAESLVDGGADLVTLVDQVPPALFDSAQQNADYSLADFLAHADDDLLTDLVNDAALGYANALSLGLDPLTLRVLCTQNLTVEQWTVLLRIGPTPHEVHDWVAHGWPRWSALTALADLRCPVVDD